MHVLLRWFFDRIWPQLVNLLASWPLTSRCWFEGGPPLWLHPVTRQTCESLTTEPHLRSQLAHAVVIQL
jgi:hypothetical protein